MDRNVYPVFYALVKTLKELPIDRAIPLATLYKVAVETVGEYEHGTADIEDLDLDDVQQYKNVLEDFLNCLQTYIEAEGEQNE